MSVWADMQQALDDLERADMLRAETALESPCAARVTVAGREVVCLCSNDYLGLACDESLRTAAVEAVGRWGVGAGGSRLLCGTSGPHVELERRLACFKRAEAAIVTASGWVANHAAVTALAGAGDLIVCDKLSHASIIDAARSCGARLRTFAHRRTDALEKLLHRHRPRFRRCLIVTDSLFSMDGDLADLPALVAIKNRFDAQLLIDEAHATGVIGADGRGVAELMAVEDGVDAVVGTLSKAIGCVGGFVAGPGVLIETIRNTARPYIFTTALPPAMCAAAARALEIIRDRPERRRKLLKMADELRRDLREAAFDTGDSAAQIIPVLIGSPGRALAVSRMLFESGFLLPAIRPPTVARGTSRLRISLTADHEPADLRRLVSLLRA